MSKEKTKKGTFSPQLFRNSQVEGKMIILSCSFAFCSPCFGLKK